MTILAFILGATAQFVLSVIFCHFFVKDQVAKQFDKRDTVERRAFASELNQQAAKRAAWVTTQLTIEEDK